MMLPSADSIRTENHHRNPNGIPLDSVTAENALVGTNRADLADIRSTRSTAVLFASYVPIHCRRDSALRAGGHRCGWLQDIRSTNCAREDPGLNGSQKYGVSRATFPSRNSMMLTE